MTLQDALKYVARFVTGDYDPEEQATFLKWLKGATVDEWDSVADEHERLYERWPVVALVPSAEWIGSLEAKLDRLETPVISMDTGVHVRRGVWVAAASVAILLVAGTVWYAQFEKSNLGEGTSKTTTAQPAAPLLSQRMDVPKGGRAQQMVLADGSKILLNSASTLRYPATFDGSERVVELNGEAYFQVVSDPNKPFKVLIRGAEVEVLGTRFDIMAYDDEPISKTTLIDGSVRMISGSAQNTLKPGQQVQLTYASPEATHENTMKVVDVDTRAVLDWQKGVVDFEGADLHAVMRTLSRYYNVEIKYASDLPATQTITARMFLQDDLQHNLKNLLESEFRLHYKIDGKLVTVTR